MTLALGYNRTGCTSRQVSTFGLSAAKAVARGTEMLMLVLKLKALREKS